MIARMVREDWDWSRPVVDHLDVHASDFARYRDVGNPGHRD
jgi:hypothetical protein